MLVIAGVAAIGPPAASYVVFRDLLGYGVQTLVMVIGAATSWAVFKVLERVHGWGSREALAKRDGWKPRYWVTVSLPLALAILFVLAYSYWPWHHDVRRETRLRPGAAPAWTSLEPQPPEPKADFDAAVVPKTLVAHEHAAYAVTEADNPTEGASIVRFDPDAEDDAPSLFADEVPAGVRRAVVCGDTLLVHSKGSVLTTYHLPTGARGPSRNFADEGYISADSEFFLTCANDATTGANEGLASSGALAPPVAHATRGDGHTLRLDPETLESLSGLIPVASSADAVQVGRGSAFRASLGGPAAMMLAPV
jgi:hypothetical protein